MVVDGGGGERRGRVPCQSLCCGYRKTLAQSEMQRKNERKQELSGNELIKTRPQCTHVTKLGTVSKREEKKPEDPDFQGLTSFRSRASERGDTGRRHCWTKLIRQ